MSLLIRTRLQKNMAVVDLAGRLSILESGLLDTIHQLLADGYLSFAINLREVTYIDASGLGQLLTTVALVTRNGGEMILMRPSERVRKLLEITKLNTVFEMSEDDGRVPLKREDTAYQRQQAYA